MHRVMGILQVKREVVIVECWVDWWCTQCLEVVVFYRLVSSLIFFLWGLLHCMVVAGRLSLGLRQREAFPSYNWHGIMDMRWWWMVSFEIWAEHTSSRLQKCKMRWIFCCTNWRIQTRGFFILSLWLLLSSCICTDWTEKHATLRGTCCSILVSCGV